MRHQTTSDGNRPEADAWRKASSSYSNGGCVEVGQDRQVIAVRDSKNPGGPVLAFSPREWRALCVRLTGDDA